MTDDYELPKLPSDEELGITEEDRRAFEEGEDGPEGSDTTSRPTRADGSPTGAGSGDGTSRGTAGSRMPVRGRWRGIATFLFLVVVGWVSSIRTGLPEPAPASAPATEFSSARAMAMLVEIARAPRPAGSPEHARVRGYLVDRLRSLGLEPQVQTATALFERPGLARSATVRNIVARIPGTDPTGAVLITAHYDGVELSPAAGDAGSGLVAILEAVRALRAGPELRNDVIVLLSDAEELGLLGARAFVAEHPWMEEVDIALSFEMRGSAGPSIMFETADRNGWVVRALQAARPEVFAVSLGEELYRYMPNATDFTVLEEAGVQGLNFAAIANADVYHTPRDIPSELSEATLQSHGVNALSLLRELGDRDLTDVRAPDVVYFTLPVLGLVVYPATWVLPLSGLLLLVAAGAFVLARRRGARVSATVVGFGISLVAMSLGYGAGVLMVDWARGIHFEDGSLPAALFYGEGWYVLAIAGAAMVIVSGLTALAGRWMSLAELGLGATVLPLAGAVGLAAALPLAAMSLQWPTLALLVAIALLALLGPRASGVLGWLVAVLAAVPVLVLMVPSAELTWIAGTLGLAGPLGALMVMSLLLALPAMAALRTPNAWWVPLTSALLAAGCLGMARLGADVSAVTPLPSTLVYVLDRDAGTARWVSDDRMVGGDVQAAWDPAAAWVGDRVEDAFDQRADLTDVGYGPGQLPVADADPVTASPPTLAVLDDETFGSVRRVVVGLRSEVGAERLYVRPLGEAGATRVVAVNGRRLSEPDGLAWLDHWGTPDSLVTLELAMPAGAPVDLLVSEHHLRPEELLGPRSFARPPGLQADPMRSSDRAILTTRFRGSADPAPAAVGTPTNPDSTADPRSAEHAGDAVPLPDRGSAAEATSPADTASPAVGPPPLPEPQVGPPGGGARDSVGAPDTVTILRPGGR